MVKKLSVEEFKKLPREAQLAHIRDSFREIFERLNPGLVEDGMAFLDAFLSSAPEEEKPQ